MFLPCDTRVVLHIVYVGITWYEKADPYYKQGLHAAEKNISASKTNVYHIVLFSPVQRADVYNNTITCLRGHLIFIENDFWAKRQ